MEKVFEAAKVPVYFEHHTIHEKAITPGGDLITEETLQAIKDCKVGLKGPFATPIGKGYRSLNVTLRKKLNLYANVRPCKSLAGVETNYSNVDVITIRENTEGEYSGLEHEVVKGVVENLKIISANASRNIAEYAFDCAVKNGRKRVTACHKAGVMKRGDGLFLDMCREVAAKYPQIAYDEIQIDTVSYLLAKNPDLLDMMVMPNLYGDIVSDLCSGLVGGLGLTPSGNIGKDCSVFEAVHGTAPDIAGMDLANPTALLLSSCMMLNHIGLPEHDRRIKNAIIKTYTDGKYRTGDLGGTATCSDYTKAVIDNME